jgi:hypothetical protein
MSVPSAISLPFEKTWDAQTGDVIEIVITSSTVTPELTSDVMIMTDSTALFRPEKNQLALNDTYNKNSVPASQHTATNPRCHLKGGRILHHT